MRHFLTLIITISVCALLPTVTAGQNINQGTIFIPPGVDLVWEAASYTPPLYKGKALYPDGGTVRIVAIPESQFENSGSLYYTWRVDGRVEGSRSGIGQNVFVFSPSLLGGSALIAVDIRNTQDGKILAGGVLRLPITDTLVHVYRNDPILGIRFERAVQHSVLLVENEVILEAYPYFFSSEDRGAVVPRWHLNGRTISETSSVVFRKGESSGESAIRISLDHPAKLFQEAYNAFLIEF